MEFKQLEMVAKKLNRIRVNLEDSFSGATHSKELSVSNEGLKQIEHHMFNGTVHSRYDKQSGIRYDWVIAEVELLN